MIWNLRGQAHFDGDLSRLRITGSLFCKPINHIEAPSGEETQTDETNAFPFAIEIS
jgi:hypothetical protein